MRDHRGRRQNAQPILPMAPVIPLQPVLVTIHDEKDIEDDDDDDMANMFSRSCLVDDEDGHEISPSQRNSISEEPRGHHRGTRRTPEGHEECPQGTRKTPIPPRRQATCWDTKDAPGNTRNPQANTRIPRGTRETRRTHVP